MFPGLRHVADWNSVSESWIFPRCRMMSAFT